MLGGLQQMTPELKSFDCADHDPIDQYTPKTESVWYYLAMHIGLPGDSSSDMFTAIVATPSGLGELKARGQQIECGRPILVSSYSWAAVRDEIQERLESCAGPNWLEVQEKLRREFLWEYEGMTR